MIYSIYINIVLVALPRILANQLVSWGGHFTPYPVMRTSGFQAESTRISPLDLVDMGSQAEPLIWGLSQGLGWGP